MIFEFIILLALILIGVSVGMAILKTAFFLILLPFKLVFFLTKGILGLVFVLPLLLILGAVFLAVVPIGAALLLIPLAIVGGLVSRFVCF